jgi:hypothetical protein
MTAPKSYTASDYAGLHAGEWHFYYGYEFGEGLDDEGDRASVWGFEAKRSGLIIRRMSHEDMKAAGFTEDRFQVTEGLLFGIGFLFSEGIVR